MISAGSEISYRSDDFVVENSVIVPVYSQAKKISSSLTKIREVLNLTLQSYELVVINDGSIDNTDEILQKEKRSDPHLQVISHKSNQGKGAAVRTGIMCSRGKNILFIDSDLDILPTAINTALQLLKECDLVIGSKRHPLSKVVASKYRKFLSRFFNCIVRIIVGIKLKDTQSGIKAGNGDALRKIFEIMLVKRYAFDVELLTIAKLLNLRIKELPIEVKLGNNFKISEIIKMLRDVAAVSYRFRIKRWYQMQLELKQLNNNNEIGLTQNISANN